MTFYRGLFTLFIITALLVTGCTDAEDDAEANCSGICPPAWIQGVWEGGSPIKLHLEFTEDNVLNSKGKTEFKEGKETTNSSTTYGIKNGNEISRFTKVNGSTMDWYVDNGTISNTTRMKKQ